jgi:nitrate reductase NapAB chaperone NapD
MPICSYLVVPEVGEVEAVRARLAALPGCDVVRAANRELLLLVTETPDAAGETALREQVERLDGVSALVLTFGEIAP